MRMIRPHRPARLRIDGESRLVRFKNLEVQPLSSAAETMEAAETVQKNPALNKLLSTFDTPLARSRHEVLRDPVQRGYFFSLLLHHDIKPDVANYRDATKADIINPAFPLGMVGGVDGVDITDNDQVGGRLSGFMAKERLDELDPGPGTAEKGKRYMERVALAKTEWDNDKPISDKLVIDAVVDYYVFCRNSLNQILEQNHILVPEKQRVGSGLANGIDRDEYLALLTMVWDGKAALVAEAAQKGSPALKDLCPTQAGVKRTEEIYADRSFREMGPAETLDRFGVTLGPTLTFDYFQARIGKDAIPSAQTWVARPDHAIAFLDARLPKTGKNTEFMTALRWLQNDKLAKPDGMEVDDVRAMLSLIAQSCMEYEQVATRSQQQRERLIVDAKFGVDSKVEKGAWDVWKFMIDFQKHPVASGALWLSAIIAVNEIRSLFGGGTRRITRLAFLAAMGGAGYAMYQKRKTGTSWFEDLTKNVTDFKNKDKQKPVEQQTMVNNWTTQLKLEDNWFTDNHPFANKKHAEAVLATLEDQPVALVMDWFEQTRQAKREGAPLPPFPAEFNGKYRAMFGDMPSKQRAQLFYGVLERFFEERGDYVLKHHLDGMYGKNGVKDSVQMGFDYMKDKYVNQIVYEVVATNFLERFQVILDKKPGTAIDARGLNLNDANILEREDVKALQKERPEVYAVLEKFLAEYRPVGKVRDSANWDMMHVFYHEADPEILRRMGQDAPAGWLEQMRDATGI